MSDEVRRQVHAPPGRLKLRDGARAIPSGRIADRLREAIEVFRPISVDEAALATTELVRVLLLQDRTEEAQETARTMAKFIIPLEEKSPAAAAAALDLLTCGQAGGGIPMELVDRVAGVLEKERARR